MEEIMDGIKLSFSFRLFGTALIEFLRLLPFTFPRLIKGLLVGEVLSRDEKKVFKKIVSSLLENPVVAERWRDESPYHGPFPLRLHLRLAGEFALILAKSFGITNVKDFVKGTLIHDIGSNGGNTKRTVNLAKELGLPENICYAISAHMAFHRKYPPKSHSDWAMILCDWHSHILDILMTILYVVAHPRQLPKMAKHLLWEWVVREFLPVPTKE